MGSREGLYDISEGSKTRATPSPTWSCVALLKSLPRCSRVCLPYSGEILRLKKLRSFTPVRKWGDRPPIRPSSTFRTTMVLN